MAQMTQIILIAHNIRSTHNVGSIFRTAEGFGVTKIILSGFTPYPTTSNDTRLPHEREKLTRQIHKTALGAETLVPFEYASKPDLTQLRQQGYRVVGLEQDDTSVPLGSYTPPHKVALVLGEEVDGIPPELLSECEDIVEIPMHGEKESFNVSVAAGIALYALTTSE
jgi:23S rRNA (guanosine2251-2'-O)-methyltransferase